MKNIKIRKAFNIIEEWADLHNYEENKKVSKAFKNLGDYIDIEDDESFDKKDEEKEAK